ncbi:hypothetical protein [Roseixanthobacter glucoisosaccharinicivorans]|uniref:hypothetical protein n=1 Tax=Roseixanthobacter glucoisosaccharinicivorans TaxID=3119923 RepID=UPI0037284183
MIYVSITGLKLKSAWRAPAFWWHAIRSLAQANGAAGNISVEARRINGIHHTLSVWQDEAAMRAYLTNGAHLAALRAFRAIATGKTCGFETDHRPSWDAVHGIWMTRGREV